MSHRVRWDRRHAEADGVGEVAEVLLRNAQLLPARGRALDLACGRGANALWLAARGLEVNAWDFSPVAIGRLQEEAHARRLPLQVRVRDVVVEPPGPERFDVILVSHFLERSLFPHLVDALAPGGRLFYQTFVGEVHRGRGPGRHSDWRLAPNELLHAFVPPLRLHHYREDAPLGGEDDPLGDVALLVASRQDKIHAGL